MHTRNISWASVVDVVVLHTLGLWGLWYAFAYASGSIITLAVVWYVLGGLGVTVGAHRYFTHQAFVPRTYLAYALAILFASTGQGTLRDWAARHLQHHGNSDVSGKDPHSPVDGLWHAHMGWILKHDSLRIEEVYKLATYGSDLRRRVVDWEARHHKVLVVSMVFGLPLFLGLLCGDVLGGFLVIGFARLLVLSHSIWSVNSFGHRFGAKTKAGSLSRNYGNLFHAPFFAILTLGEAWHSNHHDAPRDWNLGKKMTEIDIGAMSIWLLRKLGWVQFASDIQPPVCRQE